MSKPVGSVDFALVCRLNGLKATHQRMEIYRELTESNEHPDAGTIYMRLRKKMPSLSFDTVYRTLRVFEEKGIVAPAGISKDAQRYDAKMYEHQHFVCVKCGLIRDVLCEAFCGLKAPDSISEIGETHSVRVEFRGVCEKCSEKRAKEKK